MRGERFEGIHKIAVQRFAHRSGRGGDGAERGARKGPGQSS